MPGHTPNWDLAADAVNGVSRVYRSARNCKSRFENVIMLREEGKIVYDNNPKKPKKTKGIYKVKYIFFLNKWKRASYKKKKQP